MRSWRRQISDALRNWLAWGNLACIYGFKTIGTSYERAGSDGRNFGGKRMSRMIRYASRVSAERRPLVAALRSTIDERRLSQVEAARLLDTDQPTLSKVLSGHNNTITLDRLVGWLTKLGQTVEIRVLPGNAITAQGSGSDARNS